MPESIAETALRLQEISCENHTGGAVRFPHYAAMSYEWIREGLKKPGKSQIGLARAMNLDPSQISRLLAGKRDLKASEVETIKEYLEENGTRPQPSRKHVTNDGPSEMLKVLGMAEGGPDGWNLFNGETVELIRRPDNLVGVSGAYAVYITGSSMEPRYRSGAKAHIHPNRPATAGCDVLVQRKPTADGEPPLAVIKEFVKRSGNRVVLRQLNPEKTVEIKADEILSIHYVVGQSYT